MISVNENEPVIQSTGIVPVLPGTLPPISVPPNMDPAKVAQAKALFEKAGYTKEVIDAAPWPKADPAATVQPGSAHPNANGIVLDAGQQQAAWQKVYDNWSGNPADVLAQLPPGVQVRGADGQFISAQGANVSTMPAYNLRFAGLPGVSDLEPEVLQGFNRELVSTLGPLRVPETIAQQFADAVVRTIDSTGDMNEAQFASHQQSEGTVIEGLSDSKNIQELAVAGREAIKKSNPGWYANLEETNALFSAVSVLALAAIGRSLKR